MSILIVVCPAPLHTDGGGDVGRRVTIVGREECHIVCIEPSILGAQPLGTLGLWGSGYGLNSCQG